jgi:quercetin dioxygenase-like cupin family protein
MSTEQAAAAFDLHAEIASLKNEDTWQRSDRVARTLVKQANLQIVLIVLKPGARLAEHRAQGAVSIQGITGAPRVQVGAESVVLSPGHLLALAPGTLHDVEADVESAFLLTLAG